ncbi:uncharacterized protein LOC131589522 [Poecile atricapillus]|uniref:uncharacterized protein LOC131589522 n=1 Tax=Poecile atricapillus TaxID=48891 RepID=UPI0027392A42|nr:uncharacterized protein LOC131589522 [Poecile atricapillus]
MGRGRGWICLPSSCLVLVLAASCAFPLGTHGWDYPGWASCAAGFLGVLSMGWGLARGGIRFFGGCRVCSSPCVTSAAPSFFPEFLLGTGAFGTSLATRFQPGLINLSHAQEEGCGFHVHPAAPHPEGTQSGKSHLPKQQLLQIPGEYPKGSIPAPHPWRISQGIYPSSSSLGNIPRDLSQLLIPGEYPKGSIPAPHPWRISQGIYPSSSSLGNIPRDLAQLLIPGEYPKGFIPAPHPWRISQGIYPSSSSLGNIPRDLAQLLIPGEYPKGFIPAPHPWGISQGIYPSSSSLGNIPRDLSQLLIPGEYPKGFIPAPHPWGISQGIYPSSSSSQVGAGSRRGAAGSSPLLCYPSG